MQNIIYIQAPDGQPLMPTKRFKKIRNLLKTGQAKIVSRKPFAVRLLNEPSNRYTQRIIDGTDPGRTNIGNGCITETGIVLYASITITNNKDVPKHMQKRKTYRMASRRGERKIRKRRAKKNNTLMATPIKPRHLPGYGEDKVVLVKDIINTEARYSNRKRSPNWLTPTARHLVNTHVQGLKNRMKYLPITDAVIELNKFAFMALDNPDIRPWEYQQGALYQKNSLSDAISELQDGHCLFCKLPIEHNHHHQPKSEGGSDTLANMVGLCDKHHTLVHNEQKWADKLDSKHNALIKKYGALSVLNQAIPFILKEYIKLLGADHVFVTDGRTTYNFRKQFELNKNHDQDAIAIAASICNHESVAFKITPFESLLIRQFRRHDRAIVKNQIERFYELDGVVVAKNRNKRMHQKEDSLADWYQTILKEYGCNEANRRRSQLTAKKSFKRYNNTNRTLSGAIFLYHGKRYVLTGQLTGGLYYRAAGEGTKNFPARDCKIVAHNSGLVAI